VNEKERITLLQAGDEQAFGLLVREFQAKVYNTCLGLLQNAEDAEDLCQEVFIAIYQSIGSFKGQSSLSTWIYKITVTRSLEFLRTKKRRKRFAFLQHLFTGDNTKIKTSLVHFYHPGVQLENKERASILFRAIDALPENQKTAFMLSKLEDLSYQEIAEVMNVSLASVESLLFRAKNNLKKILADYYEKNEK
jgi:RNA polymerase sigma-70 factor (ECF subfamily)